MKPNLLPRAAVAACLGLLLTASYAGPKAAGDFAGAFIVEHVTTLKPQQGLIQVDVVGTGAVSDAVKATCDNHGTQVVALDNSFGSATYTLQLPGGSLALQLTMQADKAGGDPVNGIRFGGTFIVAPGSGTGVYKGATGSGVWLGGAEFTAPLVPGTNPPGPGRWAFWGTITRAATP